MTHSFARTRDEQQECLQSVRTSRISSFLRSYEETVITLPSPFEHSLTQHLGDNPSGFPANTSSFSPDFYGNLFPLQNQILDSSSRSLQPNTFHSTISQTYFILQSIHFIFGSSYVTEFIYGITSIHQYSHQFFDTPVSSKLFATELLTTPSPLSLSAYLIVLAKLSESGQNERAVSLNGETTHTTPHEPPPPLPTIEPAGNSPPLIDMFVDQDLFQNLSFIIMRLLTFPSIAPRSDDSPASDVILPHIAINPVPLVSELPNCDLTYFDEISLTLLCLATLTIRLVARHGIVDPNVMPRRRLHEMHHTRSMASEARRDKVATDMDSNLWDADFTSSPFTRLMNYDLIRRTVERNVGDEEANRYWQSVWIWQIPQLLFKVMLVTKPALQLSQHTPHSPTLVLAVQTCRNAAIALAFLLHNDTLCHSDDSNEELSWDFTPILPILSTVLRATIDMECREEDRLEMAMLAEDQTHAAEALNSLIVCHHNHPSLRQHSLPTHINPAFSIIPHSGIDHPLGTENQSRKICSYCFPDGKFGNWEWGNNFMDEVEGGEEEEEGDEDEKAMDPSLITVVSPVEHQLDSQHPPASSNAITLTSTPSTQEQKQTSPTTPNTLSLSTIREMLQSHDPAQIEEACVCIVNGVTALHKQKDSAQLLESFFDQLFQSDVQKELLEIIADSSPDTVFSCANVVFTIVQSMTTEQLHTFSLAGGVPALFTIIRTSHDHYSLYGLITLHVLLSSGATHQEALHQVTMKGGGTELAIVSQPHIYSEMIEGTDGLETLWTIYGDEEAIAAWVARTFASIPLNHSQQNDKKGKKKNKGKQGTNEKQSSVQPFAFSSIMSAMLIAYCLRGRQIPPGRTSLPSFLLLNVLSTPQLTLAQMILVALRQIAPHSKNKDCFTQRTCLSVLNAILTQGVDAIVDEVIDLLIVLLLGMNKLKKQTIARSELFQTLKTHLSSKLPERRKKVQRLIHLIQS
ncbi:hypothetical protein BLNAU_15403 [Blattamonas nauphoetae]|uniref:Uncharacterized protein n=1 Tax=Blattamonas nauphoetae TaxID=2049346 RepID=A0ABQ9XEA9_9EUKA|nr:hypothetical protein BLNAU_15403 [Blattamonas nauphoetae]